MPGPIAAAGKAPRRPDWVRIHFEGGRAEVVVQLVAYQMQFGVRVHAVLRLDHDEAVSLIHQAQAGAFQKDDGIRIDHVLLSANAAGMLTLSGIDRFTRATDKPSDHVPVWVELGGSG